MREHQVFCVNQTYKSIKSHPHSLKEYCHLSSSVLKFKPLLLTLLLSGKFSEPMKSHPPMCHPSRGDDIEETTVTYQEISQPSSLGVCWYLQLTAREIKQTLVFSKVYLFFHCKVPAHIAGGWFLELNFTQKTRHIFWRPRC